MLYKVGRTRLAKQGRVLPAGALRVGVIHSINVLHNREACRSQRISEQKRAGVSSMGRDARGGELVVMIGRKALPTTARAAERWIASWFAIVGCSPVFAGMIAASGIGLFVVPMLYVTFQILRERTSAQFRRRLTERAETP